MIEFIHAADCTECDRCVEICPSDVFDAKADAIPVLARREDCQTCYLCELYCPTDAIYVSPRLVAEEALKAEDIVAAGLLGSYRRAIEWRRGKPGSVDGDLSYRMHEASEGPLGEAWRRSSR